MPHDHHHDHEDEHDHEGEEGEASEGLDMQLALDTQTQIFLEMRSQNIELLKAAAQVAGYTNDHGPLKPDEVRQAIDRIWNLYSEFYEWVDPEESEDEGE